MKTRSLLYSMENYIHYPMINYDEKYFKSVYCCLLLSHAQLFAIPWLLPTSLLCPQYLSKTTLEWLTCPFFFRGLSWLQIKPMSLVLGRLRFFTMNHHGSPEKMHQSLWWLLLLSSCLVVSDFVWTWMTANAPVFPALTISLPFATSWAWLQTAAHWCSVAVD